MIVLDGHDITSYRLQACESHHRNWIVTDCDIGKQSILIQTNRYNIIS